MNFVIEYLTPIALGLMMIGMGLALKPDDFSRQWKQPKAVLIGLAGQIIGLPIVGFAVASSFGLSPHHAVGIMILVSCAGGVVSGLLTQMAGGDTALSITMTAISMVIGTISIPYIINESLSYFLQQNEYIKLDLLPTSMRLLAMTILPVAIGMVLRKLFPKFSASIVPAITQGSNILLALIIVLTLIVKSEEMLKDISTLMLPIFILNIFAMTLGYTTAWFAGLEPKVAKTLAIEVGIQNSATGIFIASTLLHNASLALPAMIYTGVAFVNVAIFILSFRRRFSHAKAF